MLRAGTALALALLVAGDGLVQEGFAQSTAPAGQSAASATPASAKPSASWSKPCGRWGSATGSEEGPP